MRRGPVALLFATLPEAEPFIKGLKLKRTVSAPFPVYKGRGLALVLSGIGKADAAMAAAWTCERLSPRVLVNLGAAGAVGKKLDPGDCLQISRAVEPDRPGLRTGAPREHFPEALKGFRNAVIATQDRPILSAADRRRLLRLADLADMETSAFIQACRRFGRSCFAFKFVTDAPGHSSGEDIVRGIRKHRDSFFSFFLSAVLPSL